MDKKAKNIWMPFTQMREIDQTPPLKIEKAKGSWIYDAKGNKYLDAVASWWVSALGHCHPKIAKAIGNQAKNLDQVIFANCTHDGAQDVAKGILELLPKKLTKVFFSDDGSTAVEVALKLSLQYHHQTGNPQKTKIISLEDAYHGDTIGAMSVSGTEHFFGPYKPMLFKSPTIKNWKNAEKLIVKHADKTAAIIVEPLLQAAGGMKIYDAQHLRDLAKLCKKHNIIVIYDEVATGFGRTGTMFAMDQIGTTNTLAPDMVCLSKGLTGGTVAMSVTACSNKIYKAFLGPYSANKTFFHGHSYTANPIACAASVATLKVFKDEDVINKMQKNLGHFTKRAQDFADGLPLTNFRNLGWVAAWDIIDNRKNKKMRLSPAITQAALKKGLLIRPLGNTLYFWPPITINKKEIDIMFDITKEVLLEM